MTVSAAFGAVVGGSTAQEDKLISPGRQLLAIAPLDARSTSVYVMAAALGAERMVASLGWTRDQAWQVRLSLSSFAEDWDDPAMDAYDEL